MAAIVGWAVVPARDAASSPVDIEVAPVAPAPEALPAEQIRPLVPDEAQKPAEPDSTNGVPSPPDEDGAGLVDAGVDARPDAAADAAVDARPAAAADAAVDAGPAAAADAAVDAGRDTGVDAGAGSDAAVDAGEAVAAVAEDAATGAEAGGDVAGLAAAVPSGSAEPASDGGIELASDAAVAVAVAPSDAASPSPSLLGELGQLGSTLLGTDHAGSPSEARVDTAALALALAAGSAASPPTEPAVEGAPTTAGTAANLLTYLPTGHVLTALIRLDRLRGTEWAAQTERLLRPLPDYQWLFGRRDAALVDKLETLVISTPHPRNAAATTLVARTVLPRAALRDFLAQTAPVRWSAAAGGMLGRRSGAVFPGDRRVFLSPFRGWFLLAQPADLGALTQAARGSPDAAEATGALPPWLASIRTIERETGDTRGPAAVVTIALDGKRRSLAGNDLGLGITSLPVPDRISLALELVPQGWLARGNLHFASDADAAELVAQVQRLQQRIADSTAIQLVIGKPIARVVASLAFARAGPRVSYATSASIADARAILSAVGQQLDQFFGRAP